MISAFIEKSFPEIFNLIFETGVGNRQKNRSRSATLVGRPYLKRRKVEFVFQQRKKSLVNTLDHGYDPL